MVLEKKNGEFSLKNPIFIDFRSNSGFVIMSEEKEKGIIRFPAAAHGPRQSSRRAYKDQVLAAVSGERMLWWDSCIRRKENWCSENEN